VKEKYIYIYYLVNFKPSQCFEADSPVKN